MSPPVGFLVGFLVAGAYTFGRLHGDDPTGVVVAVLVIGTATGLGVGLLTDAWLNRR